MNQELQEWVRGFEAEILRRFSVPVQVAVPTGPAQDVLGAITAICTAEAGVDPALVYLPRGKKGAKAKDATDVRQVCMYLASKYTGLDPRAIGRHYRRDRTTVLHARQVIQDRIDARDAEVAPLLASCEAKVKQTLKNS